MLQKSMLGAARRLPVLLGDDSTMNQACPESVPHVYATSAPAGGFWRRDAVLTLRKNVNCLDFICTDCIPIGLGLGGVFQQLSC